MLRKKISFSIAWLITAFANFLGVNILSLAYFNIQTWGHWTQNWEEMYTVSSIHPCPDLTLSSQSPLKDSEFVAMEFSIQSLSFVTPIPKK